MLGNYPQATTRPCFFARIRMRRYFLKMFRWNETQFKKWVTDNKKTLYYVMREFNHIVIQRQAALEEALHTTQQRKAHIQNLSNVCDEMRHMFSLKIMEHWQVDTGNNLMNAAFKCIEENVFSLHHKRQQITYSKLVHGSFGVVLYREIKKFWTSTSNDAKQDIVQSHFLSVPLLCSNSEFSSNKSTKSKPWLTELEQCCNLHLKKRAELRGHLKSATLHPTHPALPFSSDNSHQIPDIDLMIIEREKAYATTVLKMLNNEKCDLLSLETKLLSKNCINNLSRIVKYQKQMVGTHFEIWWLRIAGMSWIGYVLLLHMYQIYQSKNCADTLIKQLASGIFARAPRDFAILVAYLRLKASDKTLPIKLPRIFLGDRIARNQLATLRKREGLLPWQKTPDDLGNKYFCGCGRWKECLVDHNSEDSKDIFATGLTKTAYCNLSKSLVCTRFKDECSEKLRTVNLIGSAVRLGGKYYTICATCGVLTTWEVNRYTHLGPSCGSHSFVQRNQLLDSIYGQTLNSSVMVPILKFNSINMGLEYCKFDSHAVHCAYCHIPLDSASQQHCMFTICTWKSTLYFLKSRTNPLLIPKNKSPNLEKEEHTYSNSKQSQSETSFLSPKTSYSEFTKTEKTEKTEKDEGVDMKDIEQIFKELQHDCVIETNASEFTLMRYLKSRYNTNIYDENIRNKFSVPFLGKDASESNLDVGLRIVFFCRKDWLYLNRSRAFEGVPLFEDVWRCIHYHRCRGKNLNMVPRYRRNVFYGLEKFSEHSATPGKRRKFKQLTKTEKKSRNIQPLKTNDTKISTQISTWSKGTASSGRTRLAKKLRNLERGK